MPRLGVVTAVLVPLAVTFGSGVVAVPQVTAATPATGAYAGTVLDDEGNASAKEYVEFRVAKKGKGLKVTGYRGLVQVYCYEYPNTYYSLPVAYEAPATKVKRGKVATTWTEDYVVDGEHHTLTGHLELRFRTKGKVTGRVSVDFANCATKLGDAPYWVDLAAKRKG